MKDEYSPYKVIHHTNRLNTLKAGNQIIPTQIQLVISDKCNLNCSFCAYRNVGYTSSKNFGETRLDGSVNQNPNRRISYNKCVEIIDDCVYLGIKACQITGGGEPTVHPKHKEILEYVLEKGLELALVTNGVVMQTGMPEVLTKASWVRFSLDASNRESYKNIKGVDAFKKVNSNISKVVEAKKQKKSSVIIGIGFVVEKNNYQEIYDAAVLAKKLGVDNFRVSAAFMNDNLKYHLGHYKKAKALAARAQVDLEDDSFKVFNLFGDRLQDLIDEKPTYSFCGYMQFNTYIGGDLKVYTCCNNAYNDLGKVGSIKNKNFKDFWLSIDKIKIYNKFDARNCERCMFNNKNKFINYCIKEDAKHINFV